MTINDGVDFKNICFALDQSFYVVTCDEGMKFIDVNEKFKSITGYSRDELIDSSYNILHSGSYFDHFNKEIESIIFKGINWQGEICLKSKTGFLFWVEMSIVPIFNENSKKYIWIGNDITERKATEQFLADSQIFSKILMQEAPVGLFLANAFGSCTYVNDKWLSFCGLKNRHIMGDGWKKTIHPDDYSQVLTEWSAFIEKEKPFHCKYRYKHIDGRDIWVLANAVCLKNSLGNVSGILRTEQDLTEYVANEQIIANQNLIIASAARLVALGEMAGGIAHEINNPLAVIAVSIRAIRKMVAKGLVATEEFQDILGEVDSTVVRISKIVTGLRNVSRDASGEDFISCRIEDCLNDVLSLCSEKFKSHEVDLTVDIKEELKSASIDLMRVQFSQVLLNLLTNAFDATEKRELKWVKVLVEESDHDISFKVTDSGDGIKKEYQDKIFQPFFTTKEIGKGTGLGLSLSNTIISKHMGKFYLDKESEHTCFVISIPKKHTQIGS